MIWKTLMVAEMSFMHILASENFLLDEITAGSEFQPLVHRICICDGTVAANQFLLSRITLSSAARAMGALPIAGHSL